MIDFIRNSVFFGVTVSLAAYGIGCLLQKKIQNGAVQPIADIDSPDDITADAVRNRL